MSKYWLTINQYHCRRSTRITMAHFQQMTNCMEGILTLLLRWQSQLESANITMLQTSSLPLLRNFKKDSKGHLHGIHHPFPDHGPHHLLEGVQAGPGGGPGGAQLEVLHPLHWSSPQLTSGQTAAGSCHLALWWYWHIHPSPRASWSTASGGFLWKSTYWTHCQKHSGPRRWQLKPNQHFEKIMQPLVKTRNLFHITRITSQRK